MAKEANQQSETVSIKQIDSIYKARPGYRVVPLEITNDMPIAYSPEDVKGIAWFWIDGTKKRCLLVEVKEEIGNFLLRDLECEKGRIRRKTRCRIISPVTHQRILCPFSNSCNDCPYEDQRYKDTTESISIELALESGDDISSQEDTTAREAMKKVQAAELLKALQEEDEVLYQMAVLAKEGCTKPEIKEMLGIKKSTYYDNWDRIEKIAINYIDF